MRSFITILIALAALFAPAVQAQILSVETYVEEWDPAQQQWVRVEDSAHRLSGSQLKNSLPVINPMGGQAMAGGQYFQQAIPVPSRAAKAIATFGPFRVIDQGHAEMVGVTDSHSPTDFAAMLRAYPQIGTLRLIEAPGTADDRANMRVGRMIRAAGITTHVPRGGSVRSGAVELFLSGAERRIDDGAEFAVHSWMDIHGRSPRDFAPDAGPNKMYLDFYREMGMAAPQARDFYAMTNSVGFGEAKWLTAQDMRGWLSMDAPSDPVVNQSESESESVEDAVLLPAKLEAAPVMAYLDLDALLP